MLHRTLFICTSKKFLCQASLSLRENMSKGSTKERVNSQTITLKVNVCCKGCQKKIERALHKIHGVEDVTFEAEEKKVIVTGETDSATLIRKLRKVVGKRAELWGASNGEREEKARGCLRLPNYLKRKQKKDDDKADDDDHDKIHEEEAVPEENKGSSPPVHSGATQPPTETMMMGGGNPYHYGYQHDPDMQFPWAMQQEQHWRRMTMMMDERERYGYPPAAHWYGGPEAQGYGQQCNMYESPDTCSVM